jgi:predicted MPP superfamily phosphohydrolase
MRIALTVLQWIVRFAAACLLLGLAVFSYAWWEATWDPKVRRADVALADWPKGARPVTVLLISDTHVAGPDMPPERLVRIVDKLNGLKPDLVLLAGDYISYKMGTTRVYAPDETVAPFKHFRAPLGVVAVLGNHDHWAGADVFRRAVTDAGITLLVNDAVRRGPLVIAGADDGFSEHTDLPRTRQTLDALGGGPRIFLTHAPDIARRLPFHVDAVLAGHTHCGQIVLPFYGSVARDNDRFRWLPCGRVDLGGTPLFVGAGVGTSSLPMRLGARPDVWLIRFGPKA